MSDMLKYKLTSETRNHCGRTLYRIQALRDFSNIEAGDFGGWIEIESNLSQEGDCWVFDNALVYGKARVFDNARVFGDAKVFGHAWVFDNAKVFGHACVFDNANVFGNARVFDSAKVLGDVQVYGNSKIYGNAQVFGNARVSGDEPEPDLTSQIDEERQERHLRGCEDLDSTRLKQRTMNERPTPIVDSSEFTVPIAGKVIGSKTARKLERERDEAWACCDELVVDSNAITLAKTVMRMERERDEALAELEEYRSIAENIGAKKAVSEKEKAILERDEARKELSSIHRWIERNHADGFIDSLTYLQNLERVTDSWYDRIDAIESDARRFVKERDEAREEINELIYIAERAIALADIDLENDKFGVVSELRGGLEKIKEETK